MVCRGHFAGEVVGTSASTQIVRTYRSSTATLYRCLDCGHRHFSPFPSGDDISHYYNFDYGRHDFDYQYSDAPRQGIANLYREFSDFMGMSSLRIHDEGCGSGYLVHHFNQMGAQATGTDVGATSIEMARQRGNDAVSADKASDFLNARGEQVDAITLLHTVEHYFDPVAALNELRPFLRDRGFIFIFVPNACYLPSQRLGPAADPHCNFPAHIQYFTPQSLARALKLAGLAPVSITTTTNMGFSATMADDLLFQAVGKTRSNLPDPDALIAALSANHLSYELRAIAVRDDSAAFADRMMSDVQIAQLTM